MKLRKSMERYLTSLFMILLIMTAFLSEKTYAYTWADSKKVTNIKTITITTDKTIKVLDKYTKINNYSRGIYEDENSQSNEVVKNAISKLGLPYMIGGCGPNSFDDIGFVVYVYDKSGIKIENTIKSQMENGITVKKEEIEDGDLVFFREKNDKASHVGIYIGDNKFIHAEKESGRIVITSLEDVHYKRAYVGAKRFLNK